MSASPPEGLLSIFISLNTNSLTQHVPGSEPPPHTYTPTPPTVMTSLIGGVSDLVTLLLKTVLEQKRSNSSRYIEHFLIIM